MKKNIFILVLFFILSFILSNYYRDYIYNNKLNDFGLADIGNNILFIPSVYILILIFYKKNLFGKYIDILFHFLILTLIEVLSYFIDNIGTYDFKDIFGLAIGSLVVILLIHYELISFKKV